MNCAFLIGNLTRDPELSETGRGVSVCRFSIAVNRDYANSDGERETDFFNCVAWRGAAETVARYCKKGNKVGIVGSIQPRSYEGNDGIKRTVTEIVVQKVEFLTPKQNDNERGDRCGGRRKPQLEEFDDDGDIPF